MTNVIDMQSWSQDHDDYWGLCPECHAEPILRNVRSTHWATCSRGCGVRWTVGDNLFSSWRHEDEAVWDENTAYLRQCRDVTPYHRPDLIKRYAPKSPDEGIPF
jgi:hypothetical protein